MLSLILFNIVLAALVNAVREEKEMGIKLERRT